MKKFNLLIVLMCLSFAVFAQNTPPQNVTATVLSSSSVRLDWGVPAGATQPARAYLYHNADMVTRPGEGFHGADLCALYGGQSTLAYKATANVTDLNHSYWLADDFTLTASAQVSHIDFYAFQSNSGTTSSITGCYVRIYNSRPEDSTAVPIWTSNANCMVSTEWSGIFRTTSTNLADTTRPIMKVSAQINTALAAGTYWVAVCFTGSRPGDVYAVPRATVTELSTGNAVQFSQDNGLWLPMADNASLEQMGLPLTVRGEFVTDHLSGYNIYRNTVQVNTSLVEGFSFVDTALSESTQYCYTVEAVYSVGTSAMSQQTCVTTDNAPVDPCVLNFSDLPYMQSFEGLTTGIGHFNVPCWHRLYSVNSTSYPYITTGGYTDDACVYMNAANTTGSYVVAPPLASDTMWRHVTVQFMMKKGSATSAAIMKLGYITDPTDFNTFTAIGTVNPASNTNWQKVTVDLSIFAVQGRYIALQSLGALSYLDDFRIFASDCMYPTAIDVTGIASSSVQLSWHPTGVANYLISYREAGEENWIDVQPITDTFYTITGLNPATSYTMEIRLKPGCGGDAWYTTSVSFVTACPELTAPYVQDFEGYTGNSTTGYPVPTCWIKRNSVASSNFPGIYTSVANAYSGSNLLQFQTSASSATYGDNYVILPAFTNPINSLELSCMAREINTSGMYVGKVLVGVMSDPMDFSTFVQVGTIEPTTNVYAPFAVSFANYTGPAGRIALKAPKPLSGFNTVYMDNLVVAVANCSQPENLVQTAATDNSISCSWSPAAGTTAQSYTLAYRDVEATDDQWIEISNITDTFNTVSGLLDNHQYLFKVKVVCSAGESAYSFAETFYTLCSNPLEIPYYENFDFMQDLSYMECWTRPSAYVSTITLPSVHQQSNHAHSGTNSLRFGNDACWAATPAINANIETLTLSFWASRHNSAGGTLDVGVMSNPCDTSTFELVRSVHLPAGNSYQFVEVAFDSVHLTGQNRYIAIHPTGSNSYAYYIDDFDLNVTNPCPRPDSVWFSNITATSATATWTNDPIVALWNVRIKPLYGNEGWTEYNQEVGNSKNFINLIPSTAYVVQVQSYCGPGSLSYWSVEYVFMTGCGMIANLPYQENFDHYDMTLPFTYPDCWTHGCDNSNYNYLPYFDPNYYYSAPASFDFYSGSNGSGQTPAFYSSYAATPRIADNINIQTLAATFRVRSSSTSAWLQIGFMTDSSDITTFMPYDTIYLNEATVWEEKTVMFNNYTGNGRFLAFLIGGGTTTMTVHLDNFELDYVPTCFKPRKLKVDSISQTSVTLSWMPGDTEYEWEIAYREDTATQWIPFPYIYDTVFTIDQLLPGTTYYFKVKSVCGGTVTGYTDPVIGTTLCDAIITMPYVQNFDSVLTIAYNLPPCWHKYFSGTISNYPYVTSANNDVYSAPGALYCYATSAYFDIAVLPEIDGTIDISSLKMTFKAKSTTADNGVVVGVMDNPMNPSTFVPIKSIVPSTLGVWEDEEIYFATYTGYGRFIAIRCGDGVKFNTLRIDNLVLDIAEDCFMPLGVAARNISSDQAEMTWFSTSNISTCEYVYGAPGIRPDTATTYLVSNLNHSFVLNNLEPNTTYTFYIRNVCPSGGFSPWSEACTFTTGCAPHIIPYVQDFDSGDNGPSIMPDCWRKLGDGTVYVNNSSVNYSGNSLYMIAGSTAEAYAVLPELDATLNELQLNFFGKFSNLNYSLEVGVMSDPYDPSTFEHVETVQARTTVWNEFHIPLTSYQGTGKFIALHSVSTGTTLYMDNLSVTYAPGCVRPSNLTVQELTTTTVKLDWRPGNTESSWQLVYGPMGFNPSVLSGAVSVITTEDSLILTNLTPATYYDAYVRSVCDSLERSEWSQKCSFRTDCESITTLPFEEDFNNVVGVGQDVFPSCWERMSNFSTTTQYPSVTSSALYFSSGLDKYSLATTPPLDFNISDLQLKFDFRSPTMGYLLYVGVMDDPHDINTFVPMDTIYTTLVDQNIPYTILFTNYTGQGHYIAFLTKTTEYNYVYVDNVKISALPNCFEPEDLVVTSASVNSVTLDWSDGLSQSPMGYTIRYAEQGTGSYTYIRDVTAHPYVVTGLQPGTTYAFEVGTRCSLFDTSQFIGPVFAQTVCGGLLSLPYEEKFDSIVTTATYQTAGVLPDCWSGYSTNIYPAMQPHIISSTTSMYSYPSSAPNCLMMQATLTDTALAVLPLFDEPMTNVRIAFTRRMTTSSTSSVQLMVGYVTNPYDMRTFVPVSDIEPKTALTRDTVSFQYTTNVPAGARIAFQWRNTYTGAFITYRCCIDDIKVMPAIVCDRPTDFVASNVTAEGATVSWNGYDALQWSVRYRPVNTTSWATMTVNAPTCNLTNLVELTTYELQAQPICTNNVAGPWSDPFTFTTPQANVCLDPTSLTCSNVTYSSVDLSWDQNNAQSWNIRYKTAVTSWTTIAVNTNHYTLTALDAETPYEVQVQAVCDNNLTSDWTASVTFTTLQAPVCNAPTNLAVAADIYRATVVWTPGGDENTWNVQIRANTDEWSEVIVETHTDHVFNNLSPNTPYQVRVQAVCDELTSDFAMISFNTLPDGIADYELGITLYPNPNNGRFTINNEQLTINNVQVYDVYGKLLKTVEAGDHTVELDVRELASGMYFVRISTEKGVVTKSFVKK